jgi:NTP pyrophosphatase (non-canonical NTP hydrolase)
MKEVFKKHVHFVNSKFPGHTEEGHYNKLKEEVKELGQTLNDETIYSKAKELADVMLVCMSYADSIGLTYEQLKGFMSAKVIINNTRIWEKQPDGTYKHIKQPISNTKNRRK